MKTYNTINLEKKTKISGYLKRWKSIIYTVLAALLSLIVLIPLYWVISTSLKDRAQVIENPLGPPVEFHWENYPEAWETGRFGPYFRNSVLITVPTVLGVLMFSFSAAFAFSILNFPFKEGLYVFFITGLTIPLGVLVVPLYYQMLDLKLLDTHWAIILPQIAVVIPFGIMLLRSFIQEIPSEILDAGRVDGCSNWLLLRHIVFPLSRSALLSLMVFEFMWSWNEFLLPVVLLQTERVRTLPLGLNFFHGRFSTNFPLLMAGAVISFLPVVIVYILFQRQFVRGITAGALK